MTAERIKVGVIASAHGIRGQVKIKCFTEHPESLLAYTPLTDAGGTKVFTLKKQGMKDDLLIVSIDGVADRNAAESLRGTTLHAPAPASTDDADGWTYAELIGLKARLPDGTPYGTVSGVYNFGAGDIFDIALAAGGSEMLPLRDEFVGDIDVVGGFVVVMPPDYLEIDEDHDKGDAHD